MTTDNLDDIDSDLIHDHANERARGATLVASPRKKSPWFVGGFLLLVALVVGGFFWLGGDAEVDPGDVDVDVDVQIDAPDIDIDAPDVTIEGEAPSIDIDNGEFDPGDVDIEVPDEDLPILNE